MNFFFTDTATTEIQTLSLHDALPIYRYSQGEVARRFALVLDEVSASARSAD